LGDRPITVARELTKLHEEIVRTTSRRIREVEIAERGEFTIVLAPYVPPAPRPKDVDDATLSAFFCQMTDLMGLARRQALVATAQKFGLSPNDLYGRLERFKASSLS